MRSLTRMFFAEFFRLWRQGVAIVGLLACGIAIFVMSTGMIRALETSRDRYYRDYRFADLFAQLVRAPLSLVDRIAEIPGVKSATGRIVREVLVDVSGMVEPVSCRLVSVQPDPVRAVNGIYLRRGRLPEPSDRVEVVVNELFAQAHGLNPGDSIVANMAGRLERLHIVGIGLSPEYIYVVQPGLLLSDDRRYGVLWAPYRDLAPAFNMEGAFNHVSIELYGGANARDVMHQIDILTKPYGGLGAYDRSEQESHERVSDEMHQVRAMAILSPTIFLLVTLFLLHIVFSRLVHQQRESIATLRAFGYYPFEIGWHYSKIVLVWVCAGVGLGIIVGMRLALWMGSFYMMFFRFPAMDAPSLSWEWVAAIAMSFGVALLGSFSSIRAAMNLPPAVAMRPEAPSRFRSASWDQGIASRIGPVARMVIRRLESNPWITLFSTLGLALGLAILVLSAFMEDTIDYVIDHQFAASQRQDMTFTFHENASESAVSDVLHMDGVLAAEPFRSVPIRIRYGHRSKRLGLMGLESNPMLFRVIDDRNQSMELRDGGGLRITRKLAELIRAREGDVVEIELMEGQDRTVRIPIATVFPNYTGPAAFMNRFELHRLLEEGERVSGTFVRIDSAQRDRVYRQVKETPAIAGILDKQAAVKNFRNIIARSTFWMRTVNALFAAFIAFGVSYNSALIAYTERARDLATMRVMGFSRRELAAILLTEIGVITLLAIPIGIPLGYAFCYWTTTVIDTESHRFPLIVHRDTFFYGIIILCISIAVSSFAVLRLLRQIDILAVLKVHG
ncbi:MAG: ABC transporter permease [Planctomycetota bacterium]